MDNFPENNKLPKNDADELENQALSSQNEALPKDTAEPQASGNPEASAELQTPPTHPQDPVNPNGLPPMHPQDPVNPNGLPPTHPQDPVYPISEPPQPSPFNDPPIEKPWFKTADIKPEPGYNPYRDDFSLFQEIREEYPRAYLGAQPLPEETESVYKNRKRVEYLFTKSAAKKKLKTSSGFISLLCLIFVVVGFVVATAASMIFANITEGATEERYNELYKILNYSLNAFQYLFIFPLIFFIGTVGQKAKCKTFFQKPKTSPVFTFRWCIISLGVTYIVSIAFDWVFSILEQMGMHINDLSSELPTEPWELAIYFLFVVICAPLFEEILFRGIMLSHFKKYGCIFASVITGVLFGLIHQNHGQMFFAAALGFIFAIIDLKAGSILPSIFGHVVVNGYNFLNTLVASGTNYNDIMLGTATELEGPAILVFLMGLLNLVVFAAMGIAVILLIIEFIKFPETFKLPAGDSMLTPSEKFKSYISSPLAIITLIVLFGMVYLNSFFPMAEFVEQYSQSMSEMMEQLPQ